MSLTSVTITTSYARLKGGMVYILGGTSAGTFTIYNPVLPTAPLLFNGLSAGVSGGGFYIDHPLFSVSIDKPVSVTNSKALTSTGGFMEIIKSGSVSISNSFFYDIASTT